MIEAPDFLPLGSVVTVSDGGHPLMIVSRAIVRHAEDGDEYYDYGLILYPEGMIGDGLLFTNHECIHDTLHEGYRGENDASVNKELKETVAKLTIKKGNPLEESAW